MEKKCKKCGEGKSLSAFYSVPGNLDGLSGSCKACNIKQSAKRNEALSRLPGAKEKLSKINREKYFRLYSPLNSPFDHSERYAKKSPELISALNLSADLNKPGFKKIHYNLNPGFERDVFFLTKKDRDFNFRLSSYDPEIKFYRASIETRTIEKGEILNSREKYETYFKEAREKIGF